MVTPEKVVEYYERGKIEMIDMIIESIKNKKIKSLSDLVDILEGFRKGITTK